MKEMIRRLNETFIPGVLNSYSVIFFFNNRMFAFVLIIISFFNFFAGLSGFISASVAVLLAMIMGFDKTLIRQGIFSFNALLTGIGMGAFFQPGIVYFIVLLIAVLFCVMLSVILSSWLGKYRLPFLSIPFVLSIWLVLLPSGQFTNIGLAQRNIYWMNEMYAIGGKPLLDFFQTVDNLPLNKVIVVYLRSMSSIFFQDNLIAGILITVALFFSSRIAFSLSLIGFLAAWLFAHLTGTDMASFSFYNVGANYILVAIAVGGFFTVPSRLSYLWAILLVPLTSLMLLFLHKIFGIFALPVFSLPFSVVTIMFIYFLILRTRPGKLVMTPYQHYSPEINLYTYINNVDRLSVSRYLPLHLPFWGEWTVNQGYDGKYTHKGEWRDALDFVLVDENAGTSETAAGGCDRFYCFNKPVIAPADGVVAEVVDGIEDNEPGRVNTVQNWGNTVIIRHLDDLFTQVSHLKAGSVRVKKGDFVRKGDLLASCGNSGRSHEPHLHFQVQTTGVSGAKTLAYPIAYYFLHNENNKILKQFTIPSEGDHISNITADPLLRASFDLAPGMILKFRYTSDKMPEKTVSWEVFTDAWNSRYIYCSETKSAAYFINDGTMFYFTAFYGNKKSLLHYFYLTAFRVLLGYYPETQISDNLPLHIAADKSYSLWLHDIIAPFYQYKKSHYTGNMIRSDRSVNPVKIEIGSELELVSFRRKKQEGRGRISLSDNMIKEFVFESPKTKICATRSDI